MKCEWPTIWKTGKLALGEQLIRLPRQEVTVFIAPMRIVVDADGLSGPARDDAVRAARNTQRLHVQVFYFLQCDEPPRWTFEATRTEKRLEAKCGNYHFRSGKRDRVRSCEYSLQRCFENYYEALIPQSRREVESGAAVAARIEARRRGETRCEPGAGKE